VKTTKYNDVKEMTEAEVRRLTSFDRFMCERDLVFDSLIYLEPASGEVLERSNVMKFKSFGDSTSSRVQYKLKAIGYLVLMCRKTAINQSINQYISTTSTFVLCMTLNCIHIFIVTGSVLY